MIREIQAGEDVAVLLGLEVGGRPSLIQVAAEEAKHLGCLYASNIPYDSRTDLTRAEIYSRLLRLRALYGPPVLAALRAVHVSLP